MNEEWRQSDLAPHIDLLTGYPFNSEGYCSDEDGIRLLRGDNVVQGAVRWEGVKRWPADNASSLTRYELQVGDIVIALDRTWVKSGLKAAVITSGDIPSLLVQRVARIRAKSTLDQSFLSVIIQSHRFVEMAKTAKTETAVPHISPNDIRDFIVQLPPIIEQRRIAEILRTWDEAIEKLEALRAAKTTRLTALTQRLVFGKGRLSGHTNGADTVAYRWFMLPADWKCEPINAIAEEVSERHLGDAPIEVLSCSKYDGFVRSLDYFKKQVFSSDLDGYKKIWRNDFGFPSNHVEEGSIGLQDIVDVGLVSPIYTVFRFDPTKVIPEYAFAVLKTAVYRHIFEVSTSASVDRRGSLRWREFSKLPFPLPSKAEQVAIMEVLRTGRAEIAALTQQIQAVTDQKRGLMQKLLTGEWRVNPHG
jgi:type I restriction enzyme S subunit